jgi:phosphate transport system substrate-binding protein
MGQIMRDSIALTRGAALMMVAAAALATGFGSAAHGATTPLYGGGATLDEKVLRNIFNIYGDSASGELGIGVTAPPTTPYNANVEVLYLGVGSGNALKAYDAHDPSQLISGGKKPDDPPVASTSDFGPFYGAGTGSSWVPASSGPFYPKLAFTSSDGLGAADVSAVEALGFGPPIQVPALVTPIALAFTPIATPTIPWNPKGSQPAGGSSKVQLRTNTICGIFTGAITDWSDPEITADNNKVRLGSGAITIVYRHDSGATTFLLTNSLLNQCGTTTNPVSTHPVPDQWLADQTPAIPNTPPYNSNNLFYINVFKAGHLPANFYNNSGFAGVSGGASTNTGVQKAIDANPGAIGYLSTDFVQPVQTGNDANGNPVPAAVNVQTYHSYAAKLTPKYVAPTATTANLIVYTLTPPSFTGTPSPAQNPLNWGPTNPAPSATGAYPFGGFALLDVYSCYAAATDVTALVGTTPGSLGLLRWFYGSAAENGGSPASILTGQGYSPIPAAWTTAVKKLLTTYAPTKIGTPGQAHTACAGVSKGA